MNDDLISRAAVIDAICDNCDAVEASCPHYPCDRYVAVEKLPPAQPEQKKGQWINVRHDNIAECSRCGVTGRAWMNFCFDCGADMRGEQDETD